MIGVQDWQTFGIGSCAVLGFLVIVMAAAWLRPTRMTARHHASEVRRLVRREDERLDRTVWPTGFSHEISEYPISVFEAQQIMQQHRMCHVDDCPRKTIAWRILVETGRIKPDTSRSY